MALVSVATHAAIMGLVTATHAESTHTHVPVLAGVHLIVFLMVAALPGIAPLFVRKIARGTRLRKSSAAIRSPCQKRGANSTSARSEADGIPLNSLEARLGPHNSPASSTDNMVQVRAFL